MFHIAVLPGDGIGPEITREAVKVLKAVGRKYRLELVFSHHLVGGASIDAQGVALSDELVETCRRSDAVLFGAVGGPRWDHLDLPDRADYALIRLRRELSAYANLRQFRLYAGLEDASQEYPDVDTRHEIVDAGAMNLIRKPAEYDVIIMPNMFGDILGDEAAVLAGSIGMVPSAEFSLDGTSLYEPIHGSANDIEGRNVANPIGTVLSAGLLLRYSLGCPDGAFDIERAVGKVIGDGYRTSDIWTSADQRQVSTTEMGDLVVDAMA